MQDITKLPPLPDGQRPESGPMQFGDDWPGIFMRGDTALFSATYIHLAAEKLPPDDAILKAALFGVADMLRSCSVGDTGWPPKAV